MKRLAIALFLALAGISAQAQDPADDKLVKLDSLVDRYVRFISREDVESKKAECDFLVSSLSDSAMVSRLVCRLFDSYSHSRVMGDEAVAIYVWDRWLADKSVSMPDENSWYDARMFAEFNRNSLLGMEAPALELRKPCGGTFRLPRKGRTAILYFYDTDCGKCKIENQLLPTALRDWDKPADFYAIYVGSDKQRWSGFRRNFRLGNGKLRVFHLWDPEVDSDYIRLYAVLSTPKIFVIKDDGLVAGRRLELDNLTQLLPYL